MEQGVLHGPSPQPRRCGAHPVHGYRCYYREVLFKPWGLSIPASRGFPPPNSSFIKLFLWIWKRVQIMVSWSSTRCGSYPKGGNRSEKGKRITVKLLDLGPPIYLFTYQWIMKQVLCPLLVLGNGRSNRDESLGV